MRERASEEGEWMVGVNIFPQRYGRREREGGREGGREEGFERGREGGGRSASDSSMW